MDQETNTRDPSMIQQTPSPPIAELDLEPVAEQCSKPTIGRQLWALRNVLIVLLTPVVLLPLPIVVDDPKTNCAYVILVMAVFWMTEAVPIAATSLMPIFMFPMMGMLPASTVSATYLNDASVLCFGSLVVAVAIETWGIHRRIALRMLVLVGAEPKRLMAGVMASTWFLSIWIANTATTAMMIPIINTIMQQLKTSGQGDHDKETDIEQSSNSYKLATISPEGGKPADTSQPSSHARDDEVHYQRMFKALSLSVCFAANIGGIAGLTGTGSNVVLKGQSDMIFADNDVTCPVTFSAWFVYGLPLSIIVLVILWIWMQIYFLRCRCCGTNDKTATKRVTDAIKEDFKKLGPMSFAQWSTLTFTGLLMVLWITRDFGSYGGWGLIFKPKFASDSTPALLISFLLFIFPADRPAVFCLRKKDDVREPTFRPLLTWKDVQKKMTWSLYLLFGAGFSLAKASQVSGLSDWIGEKLQVFADLNPYITMLIICYIVSFATQFMSNVALTTLMMPIMAKLSTGLGYSPLFFMFPVAVASSFAFMLPIATPPNAIVFSYGNVGVVDMASCGFIMNILSVPVIVFATSTWGNAFFDLTTLPAGFLQGAMTNSPLNVSISNSTN
ncbi:solute carrier family 13 member 5-like [Haliotis rubra]|uniref:solute carrier family 13 member 5-like n=1 Tax=Haliotis rubra TaxID=36100 RepID=UPI001EE5C63B|nr:solute carrier family 13 member 5-like [Haliotis rubra]